MGTRFFEGALGRPPRGRFLVAQSVLLIDQPRIAANIAKLLEFGAEATTASTVNLVA
jgi:hypothetical protein